MSKIGLFGGTFNPIHFGHINLAFELMEKGGLDEVWWIPTSRSPLRSESLEVTSSQRLAMLERALEGIPEFKVLDLEINEPSPSYTIDTVNEILETHPDKIFFLLLGKDSLTQFMAWKEPLELIKRISLLIGGRKDVSLPLFPEDIQAAIEKGMLETTLLEISATQIRERLKKRLYSGHLLPSKVLDFIYLNQLYFIA